MFTFVTFVLFIASIRRLLVGPMMFDSMKAIDLEDDKEPDNDRQAIIKQFIVAGILGIFIEITYLICAADVLSSILLLLYAVRIVIAAIAAAMGTKVDHKRKYTAGFIVINSIWVAYF